MTTGNVIGALEYGVKSMGRPGELGSGDLHVVRAISTGALICVVDGLGHGAEASTAAQSAVATVEAHAEEPIDCIFRACDERLRNTRGVVMSLVSFDIRKRTLASLSIGNIEGGLIHLNPELSPGYQSFMTHPGVVGFRLPPLAVSGHSMARDDLLILATDGIRSDYLPRVAGSLRSAGLSPQALAEHIGTHFTKGSDDALVLVARPLGR